MFPAPTVDVALSHHYKDVKNPRHHLLITPQINVRLGANCIFISADNQHSWAEGWVLDFCGKRDAEFAALWINPFEVGPSLMEGSGGQLKIGEVVCDLVLDQELDFAETSVERLKPEDIVLLNPVVKFAQLRRQFEATQQGGR